MAYAQVATYGMSSSLGNISFDLNENRQSPHKPYSEATARLIDEEVRLIIAKSFKACTELLTEKKEEVQKLAELLLEKEVINRDDVEGVLGKRIWPEPRVYEEYVRGKDFSSVQ